MDRSANFLDLEQITSQPYHAMSHTIVKLCCCLIIALQTVSHAVPTVLSTDIGGDIDDTWALAHVLRSPELELKMVLTETGDPIYRGKIAAKLLSIAKRTDVVVALGKDFGGLAEEHRFQNPWISDYELSSYAGVVRKDGVDAFIELVQKSNQPIKVIAIGPAPSLAQALEKEPELAKKCDLYGMFGSFDKGYGGSPEPSAEANVRGDVNAFRILMSAPWKSITITPLDTCGMVHLKNDNYRRIWCRTEDPLMRAVIENYCIWAPRVTWMKCDFFTLASSTLFDDVAVYMAYDGSLLQYETIRFSVSDDGFTRRDANGPYEAKVAIEWRDLLAFESFLSMRLLGKN